MYIRNSFTTIIFQLNLLLNILFLVLILFVFIKDGSDQYFQNSINISKFFSKK